MPDKIQTLKLAPLLAEFLFTYKRLDLPGIGTFQLSGEGETTGIHFENNPAIGEVPELVSFLSSKTGKMKALAAADLDSHITLALEFLNIGKPFRFEGIGSLIKRQAGGYEFIAEKSKDFPKKEINLTPGTEEFTAAYENVSRTSVSHPALKKLFVGLMVIASLFLALWLGYKAYRHAVMKDAGVTEHSDRNEEAEMMPASAKQDSLQVQHTALADDRVKFVLEVASPARAFYRYNKLKSYNWDVHMETQDSLKYKIFFLLKINPADTARILDSLTLLNGRKVYIEY